LGARGVWAAAAVVAAWIAYEIVMAWVLREEFTLRDWAALTAKLSYLLALLAAVIAGPEVASVYAALASPVAAGAVRATQGWLGYTWFTVLVPLVGLAGSLYAWKRSLWPRAPAAALVNGAAAAYYGVTLWGRVYQAPEEPVMADFVVFAMFFLASAVLERLGRVSEDATVLYWAAAVWGFAAVVFANSQFTRGNKLLLAAAYAVFLLGMVLVIVSLAGQRGVLGRRRSRPAAAASD